MMRTVVLCCLVVILSKTCFAINAYPSHTVFYALDGEKLQSYIELYWQVDANTVQFKKNEQQLWLAKVKTEVTVSCDTGIILNERYYLKTTPANSLKAALLQNIIDLQRCYVPNGKIYFTLKLSDEDHPETIYIKTDTVIVEKKTSNTFYSNLQLVDTAYQSDLTGSIFYKNENLHVPLCIDFLAENRKYIHYYAELYGSNYINDSLYPLRQHITISKKMHEATVLDLEYVDTIQKSQKILPLLNSFKIDGLPSGNYYLNVSLFDKREKLLTKEAIFFQRSNPNPTKKTDTTSDSTSTKWEKVNVFDLGKTFVSKYSTAQLKAILKMLLPICNKIEGVNIEMFINEPDDTHMRYFIYNFWNERSPGDAGKGWEDYAKKVKTVNKLFGASGKPGYETDRGFYYLKYNEPDNRLTVSNEQGAHPYEIWVYNSPGKQSTQGVLLFYNPGFMINDYELLHTTIMGDVRNTAWRSYLYKSGQSSNNLNSRAEQLIQNN